MTPFPGREPVFVDPSGRRHRSVRRLGALLAVPAAGYLLLLGSSLLGGPAPNTPFIPLPDAVRPQSKPTPVVTPTIAPTTTAPTTPADERTRTTPSPTSTLSAIPTVAPTTTRPSTPGQTSKPTTAPSPTTTPGTHQRGKPTAPPGRTDKSPAKP
ncbi:hypothetical protein OG394_22080 [Kribbella sp. NBC_01245]|uniref:hypothetical protein n=1 Tax=Kribbella sp. NBC_01245 TaxID=2903578 RepID=UPI002E2E5B77|nr:hypothetical protein [Kribbella sp. NBC_01245]